jgi:hypothetical protein
LKQVGSVHGLKTIFRWRVNSVQVLCQPE